MRMGQNPLRDTKVDGYAPIVLSVITHLPDTNGYHKGRLNVIKCTLETMRANAGDHKYQIMVWDNGSCDALTHWLKRSYQPDFLIAGPNVGKSIARASIVNMLPRTTVVGVSDDDMFYYPGWLDAHLEVLRVYPSNVGTVSGWPVRTQFRFFNHYTIEWAKRATLMERGRFISEQEDKDFCKSIGREYAFQQQTTVHDKEIKLTYQGVETYATGHHCQWMGIAGTVSPYLTYTPEAMADERPFEEMIDRANLLRLTTFKRFSRHIGNVLDPELEELWRKLR